MIELKLLISPMNEAEAVEAIVGGADIIDVKNPREGALGANFPWVIRRVRELAPANVEISCTIGELPNFPGVASLAALGAAATGVNYVKAGLGGLRTIEEAVYLMQHIARAVKEFDSSIKVVVVGYADAERAGAIDPLVVPDVAFRARADVVMLDTAVKDGKRLFDFLTVKQLGCFVEAAHNYRLEAALAGSLRKEDLPVVYALGADVAGLRAAACTQNDRINGRVTREKVQELAEIVRCLEAQAVHKRRKF